MRPRLVLAAAVLGAVSLVLPSASAAPAPPTLDGKKVTTLTVKGNGGLQVNNDNPVPDACPAGRCLQLPFVYQPAPGVDGGVMFKVTWDNAASDMDLYVAEVLKSGFKEVGHCAGGTPTPGERLYVAAGTMRKGKTYALLIDVFRSVNDNVVGTVSMPAKDDIPTAVPANVENLQHVNCTL